MHNCQTIEHAENNRKTIVNEEHENKINFIQNNNHCCSDNDNNVR